LAFSLFLYKEHDTLNGMLMQQSYQ